MGTLSYRAGAGKQNYAELLDNNLTDAAYDGMISHLDTILGH